MEKHQCIAIGINRYHFLQPLNHAEADAQILYHFLVEEAKISPQRSLLLTDTSPRVNHRSTYPDRDNLSYQLRQLAHFPAASVWFFLAVMECTTKGKII